MHTLYACKDFSGGVEYHRSRSLDVTCRGQLFGTRQLTRQHALEDPLGGRLIVVACFLASQNQASCLSALQRRFLHRPLLGLASSRLGVSQGVASKAGTGSTACRAYTSIYIGSVTQSLLAVGARRHHAAWRRRVDRRGGSKETKPTRCCASLYCRLDDRQQQSGGRSAAIEFCVAVSTCLCARRGTSKEPSTGHGVTDGALRYEAAETVRKGRARR